MHKQVSVFLENKQGRLKDVLKVLADAQVDIRALTIAETANYGVLRLLLDNTEKGLTALKENDFRVKLTDVIGVEIQDVTGSIYNFVDMLYQHNINVEYAHSSTPSISGNTAFIIRVDEDKLEEALNIIKNSDGVELLK